MQLNDDYWSNRYKDKQTGWDVGAVTTPLKEYIDQLEDRNIKILIPGCGNAYEARYLLEKGFTDITLIDISSVLVERLAREFAGDNRIRIIHQDFFEHAGVYDLVLEQTFFCALDPSFRKSYVQKMHSLLAPGGRIAGVLFSRAFEGGPPFGGSVAEYQKLFEAQFKIRHLDPCYNSIPPRAGSEVFIEMIRQ